MVPATDVIIVAGFQLPDIPFNETTGRIGRASFWQRGPIAVNNGVVCGVIVIDIVIELAHFPAVGVKA